MAQSHRQNAGPSSGSHRRIVSAVRACDPRRGAGTSAGLDRAGLDPAVSAGTLVSDIVTLPHPENIDHPTSTV
jgi:hypothetical protein